MQVSFQTLAQEYDKLQEKYKSLAADYYDLHFEHEKLAIFCDSRQYHSSSEARSKDENISARLAELGIAALRIQGVDIVNDLSGCVEQIKKQLSCQSV